MLEFFKEMVQEAFVIMCCFWVALILAAGMLLPVFLLVGWLFDE